MSIDGEYRGGVIGDDEAHEGDDERVGESEGGESDEPRKRFRAGGGRTMRISDGPWCASSWGALGRRPKSERVNARLAWETPVEGGGRLIIG